MKKNNTCPQSSKGQKKAPSGPITIGMDLGDKTSRYCVLNSSGEVVQERSVATTKKGMTQAFSGMRRCRIAMEVGTHSPWVSRLLGGLGYEVIVANARQVKLISESSRKDDRLDARLLARLARMDPQLLRPIQHRSEKAQRDLMKIRVRATLVEARTGLVNAARGLSKAYGERLPKCDADAMGVRQMAGLPAGLQETLKPLLEQVESLTEKIKGCDRELEQMVRKEYPETYLLQQVSGVGTLIALTFVLPGSLPPSRPASIRTLDGASCSGASWCPHVVTGAAISESNSVASCCPEALVPPRPRSHPNSAISQ